MTYFLIVYNRSTGEREAFEAFEAGDMAGAMARRFRFESENNGRGEIEVALLGAASEDDLRATHARYFKTAAELAR